VTYSEFMCMSYGQREIMQTFIGQRLEQESKSSHPVY
jgi:hypothetical protein